MKRRAALVALLALAPLASLAGESRRAIAPKEAYTLRQLIERSKVIAVGRLAAPEGKPSGTPVLAAALDCEEVLKGELPGGALRLMSAGPLLPTGERALWFLATQAKDGSYVVDHPQCAYDVMHLGRVKLALAKPGEVGLREYLREKDEKLAQLLAERLEFHLDSGGLKPRPVSGKLQITAVPLKAKLHPGEDLSVVFTITNLGPEPIMVMNSAFQNFLLRVTRIEPPARAKILNQRDQSVLKGLDLGIEGFVSRSDFMTLEPGKKVARTLHYSPEHFPVLQGVGKIEAMAVYRVKLGKTDLDFDPWRGTLVSEGFSVEIVKW